MSIATKRHHRPLLKGNGFHDIRTPLAVNREFLPLTESLYLRDTLQARMSEQMPGPTPGYGLLPYLNMPSWWLGAEREMPWVPPVNVRETDDEIILEAYLPGVNKGDIQIEVRNGSVLVLKGERKPSRIEEKGENCWRREFAFRNFYRCFALPPEVRPEGVTVHWRDGILEVCLAKRQEARQHTYRVTVQG